MRRITFENAAFALLLAFCLLPMGMLCLCFAYGTEDQFVQTGTYLRNGLVYLSVVSAYRRVFLVLGSAAIVLAIFHLACNGKALFTLDNLKKQPWLCFLMALLVWSVVSTLLSDNPQMQFQGTWYRCEGLFSYFIYAAVFYCAFVMKGERRRLAVMRLFTLVVDVLCVFMILQVLRVDPVYLCLQAPRATVFNNLNHFGYMLCMASLCSAGLFLYEQSLKLKVLHAVSFTLLVFTLLVNDTFGAYLAVLAGLCFMVALWVKSGRVVRPILFLPLGVFLVLSAVNWFDGMAWIMPSGVKTNILRLFTDVGSVASDLPDSGKAGSGRMKLWIGALNLIPERPLFGFGPEGLTGAYQSTFGHDRPHNEFIQHAVFLGVPGLVFYLAAMGSLIVAQWRNALRLAATSLVPFAVVIGYLVSSFFGNTMFNTAPYFWMMLAFAAALPADEAKPASSQAIVQGSAFAAASRPMQLFLIAAGAVFAILIVGFGFTL